jgi:hypothetical protein
MLSDRWEEGLIAAAILALRKGNEKPVPRQMLDRPSASERLAVQLIRRLTSTVAMAADDTVSASGVEPVSAHPSMRRMLRCSCTAGAGRRQAIRSGRLRCLRGAPALVPVAPGIRRTGSGAALPLPPVLVLRCQPAVSAAGCCSWRAALPINCNYRPDGSWNTANSPRPPCGLVRHLLRVSKPAACPVASFDFSPPHRASAVQRCGVT